MHLWAHYGIFGPDLDRELATYECINIDDTQGEAPHKDIAHHFRRAGYVTLLKAASAARWGWNFQDWWESGLTQEVRMKCWSEWKAVSKVPWSGKCTVEMPSAKTRCDLLKFVYRMEPYCLHDWSGLFTDFGFPPLQLSDRILGPYQIEYLQFCFRQPVVWSIFAEEM